MYPAGYIKATAEIDDVGHSLPAFLTMRLPRLIDGAMSW
jgi:hypothetical protein